MGGWSAVITIAVFLGVIIVMNLITSRRID
jgi:hypothetical protein